RAHVEPPVIELYREAVEPVLPPVPVTIGQLVDLARSVLDRRVDLARIGVSAEGSDELRKREVRTGEPAEHHYRGDQTGVGSGVVTEVVVARVLPSEDRPGGSHHLLYERVPHPGSNRLPPVLPNHLGNH